jgi:hypothetical protein
VTAAPNRLAAQYFACGINGEGIMRPTSHDGQILGFQVKDVLE